MELPDPERSRVVLIGTSRFTDPELPDLPAIRNNLDGLAACFTDPARWGLPATHCRIVSDPDSVVALVDPIHEAATAAEDTLLIYYAGHGLVHPRTLGLLLAVVGSSPGRTYTTVPYDEIRHNVIDSRAARKVVILDCCYSGRAAGGMADPTNAVANEAVIEGTYLLASAPPNRQSLSPPGETYTAFTGALLDVLNEGLPNGPEFLHLNAIYQHVRDTLKRASRPEPQLRVDNTAGELALVRNSAPRHTPRPRQFTGPLGHGTVSSPEVLPASPPATEPAKEAPPDVDGRYRLGRIIESHSKVTVHLATDKVWDVRPNMVALVAKPDKPAERERLDGTIAKVAAIHHPVILSIRGTGEHTDRQLYVATTDFAGPNLHEVLASDGPMNPVKAVKIVADVCVALDQWHQKGLVHGDLRAVNVVLPETVHAQTVNFGIGEYVMPNRQVSAATDVYAAGRLLYELVTGRKPGAGAPAPSELRPGIPAGLDRVIMRALEPHALQRYQTAEALRQELSFVGDRPRAW